MKTMKKIAAAVAAFCSLIAFGMGTAPAMAADGYGADVSVSGNIATITVKFKAEDLANGDYVYVAAEDGLVQAVQPAASIENPDYFYGGQVSAENPEITFTAQFEDKASCKAKTLDYNIYLGENKEAGANNGELTASQVEKANLSKVLYSGSVPIPAAGNCSTGSTGSTTETHNKTTTTTTSNKAAGKLSKTGSVVMPYVVSALLLAAAGACALAVRTKNK